MQPSPKHYKLKFKRQTSCKHNTDNQMTDFMMASNVHILKHLFHAVTAQAAVRKDIILITRHVILSPAKYHRPIYHTLTLQTTVNTLIHRSAEQNL
jgi:hypothetical protein